MKVCIFDMYHARRPIGAWRIEKLPEFATRLEDGLYQAARSKAEYLDLCTLEVRLQNFARKFLRLRAAGSATTVSTAPVAAITAAAPEPVLDIAAMDHACILKNQRWLLFLRHCAKCKGSESECALWDQCKFGKVIWAHVLQCAVCRCPYPRCSASKVLLRHHKGCRVRQCYRSGSQRHGRIDLE